MEQQQRKQRQQRINKILDAMELKKKNGNLKQRLVNHHSALKQAMELLAKQQDKRADRMLDNLENQLKEFLHPAPPAKSSELRKGTC